MKEDRQDVKYTFEQVENILYKQAHKVHEVWLNKYEVDELVNEVWLKGDIQKLNNIKFVSSRAYWDMIDYIRISEGRDLIRKSGIIKRPKYINNMHDILHDRESSSRKGYDFFDDIESKEQDISKFIDNKDEIDYLLKCLPKKKRIILEKYFLEGMSLTEVGEILGLKDVTVCNFKRMAIERIRKYNNIKPINSKILRIINTPKKQVLPLEEVLPEYVVDYEIDNECALEEDIDLIEKTLL